MVRENGKKMVRGQAECGGPGRPCRDHGARRGGDLGVATSHTRPLLATAVGDLSWQPLSHTRPLSHDPNTPKKIGDASVPMGDHDDSTEIQQNLEEYEGQLVELRALLKESDEDAADEIQAVIKDLEEAVELSKELLETAKQREGDRAASHTATESSAPGRAGTRRIEAAITEAPEVKAPAVLGAKVKQQLRERQQRAALEGITDNLWMAAIGCVHTRVGQVHTNLASGRLGRGNF